MKSQNYTYEVKEEKSGIFTLVHYYIIGRDGKIMGEAKGENNANLIACALNGVA